MTVGMLLSRFQAIYIFSTFFPISLVFMVRFSNFFLLWISKLNFPSFNETSIEVRQFFSRFQVIFVFFTFFSISLVFMVRFPKFFQLYISNSNFLLHIVRFSKFLKVKDLKFKFPVVLRKQPQQSVGFATYGCCHPCFII